MGIQRNLMQVASLLFCLHLFLIGLGKVGGNTTPTGEADAHRAGYLLGERLNANGLPQTAARRHSPVLEPQQSYPLKTSLDHSDLFAEETESPFNHFNNSAPYILITFSDQIRRSCVRMKPAVCTTRLYLANSMMLC